MSRADYAHWNEEQDRVWWEEEGRHASEPSEPDEFDVMRDRELDEDDDEEDE